MYSYRHELRLIYTLEKKTARSKSSWSRLRNQGHFRNRLLRGQLYYPRRWSCHSFDCSVRVDSTPTSICLEHRYWLHICSQGLARLFRIDQILWLEDSWRVRRHMLSSTSQTERHLHCKRLWNFQGRFRSDHLRIGPGGIHRSGSYLNLLWTVQ